jgi:hypothetical protein
MARGDRARSDHADAGGDGWHVRRIGKTGAAS